MEEFNQINQDQPIKPSNNMPLAIIGTILGICSPCFIGFVVGIVAIVFAAQVNTKYLQNDYAVAETVAKNAKILAWIAIGLGIVGIIINIIYFKAIGGIDGMKEIIEQMQNR